MRSIEEEEAAATTPSTLGAIHSPLWSTDSKQPGSRFAFGHDDRYMCCCCGIDYRVMGEPNPPRLIQPLTCSPFIQFGQTSAAAISLDSASYSSINSILFPPACLFGTGSAVSLLYLCELRPFGLSIIITKYPWIVSCPRLLSIISE